MQVKRGESSAIEQEHGKPSAASATAAAAAAGEATEATDCSAWSMGVKNHVRTNHILHFTDFPFFEPTVSELGA